MSEKENELEGLLYALSRATEEFKSALEEYKKNGRPSDESQQTVWNNIAGSVSGVISKYNLSIDSIVEALPPEYRPLIRVMKRMRVDQVIDIVSDVAKEYAKDEDGNYRSLEETITRVIGKRMVRRIFK